jgi:hypothetical protein
MRGPGSGCNVRLANRGIGKQDATRERACGNVDTMLWLELHSSMDWYMYENFGILTTFFCTIDALGD